MWASSVAAHPLRFDGQPLEAFKGETVAAALTAAGVRVLRTTAGGETRGVFCGMGICYDCLMVIDDQPSRRACMVPVGRAWRCVHTDREPTTRQERAEERGHGR